MSRLSNGTMGHMWMDHWCFRCVHDHGMSHVAEGDPEQGCDVLLRMFIDEPTPELVDAEPEGEYLGWSPEHLVCRLFERCPCHDDPGWEPPVAPTPDPNQGLLFEVIDETPGIPMTIIPLDVPDTVHASAEHQPLTAEVRA